MITSSTPAMERWQIVIAQMEQTTDALGKGIDPGIFETVVGLNVQGIPTVGSCEGHLDRAVAAPWVDVEPAEVLVLRQQLRDLQDQEGVQRTPGAPYTPGEAVSRLRREIKERQLTARSKVMTLLDAFYRERWVPFDCRLIISNRDWLGRSRIECQGTDFQEVAEPSLRQLKLAEYQQEMQAFAAFLKGISQNGSIA